VCWRKKQLGPGATPLGEAYHQPVTHLSTSLSRLQSSGQKCKGGPWNLYLHTSQLRVTNKANISFYKNTFQLPSLTKTPF
jgi:hypothetical protein